MVSSHWVGTPNSKTHFMVPRRTIVNADMRVAFSPTSAKGRERTKSGVRVTSALLLIATIKTDISVGRFSAKSRHQDKS
jgi:hypothetical protein